MSHSIISIIISSSNIAILMLIMILCFLHY